jgi:hypothetical protein
MMARNLYRFYLYIIFIALVIFAVVVTAQLLGTLLALTPLRGSYASPPAHDAVVQALVFAVIGWLISGALGGLHYWLIRRDQRNDPGAGGSAIRSFFLNMSEAAGMLLVVPLTGYSIISNWAYNSDNNISYTIGIVLPTLCMVLGLEWERRRYQPNKGAALVFQRLHFFGVQLILLFFLTSAFLSAFRPLLDLLFFGGRWECNEGYCSSYQAGGLFLLLLWFTACWLLYSLVTTRDGSRLVRLIMHGASLAFGIGWLLDGVFLALEVLLSPLFHLSLGGRDIFSSYGAYNFVSPLVLGILITAVYHLLLRGLWQSNLIGRVTLLLSEGAIAALLLAALFWWGCGLLLYNLLQTVLPTPATPESQAWLAALAVFIPGIAYLPLDLLIRRRFALDPAGALGPRRSLVLALLAGGILTFAIGGAVALYAWGTALLGSPLGNWPQAAHAGLAATIVGATLIALYIWPLLGEHLLARPVHTEQPPTPETPAASTTVEHILDELLAGHITRAEAAARIHALSNPTPLLLI